MPTPAPEAPAHGSAAGCRWMTGWSTCRLTVTGLQAAQSGSTWSPHRCTCGGARLSSSRRVTAALPQTRCSWMTARWSPWDTWPARGRRPGRPGPCTAASSSSRESSSSRRRLVPRGLVALNAAPVPVLAPGQSGRDSCQSLEGPPSCAGDYPQLQAHSGYRQRLPLWAATVVQAVSRHPRVLVTAWRGPDEGTIRRS